MILVTGHLGFIGRHLTRYLDTRGRAWIGVDRRRSEDRRHFTIDVRQLRRAALDQGVTSIVHLASPVGVAETSRRPGTVRHEIVAGARRVAAIARELGAPLLFVSSSEIFGEARAKITEATDPAPISAYGRGKLEAEKVVRDGCDSTVVRLFNVYGAGQRSGFFVPNVLHAFRSRSPVPIVNGGRPVRQFTYVGDVARALADAPWHRHPGSVVCLAGPEALSLSEAVRMAGEVAGVEPEVVSVTPSALNRPDRAEIAKREVGYVLPTWVGRWRASTTFRTGIAMTLEDSMGPVDRA